MSLRGSPAARPAGAKGEEGVDGAGESIAVALGQRLNLREAASEAAVDGRRRWGDVSTPARGHAEQLVGRDVEQRNKLRDELAVEQQSAGLVLRLMPEEGSRTCRWTARCECRSEDRYPEADERHALEFTRDRQGSANRQGGPAC